MEMIRAVERGRLTHPVYLSLGQEAVAAALSIRLQDWLIFPQHRAHDFYLCLGGEPAALRDELLGLPGGTSGGRAGSNCIKLHQDGVEMFGHHGFIGENVPLGVGAALASGKQTLCIFGDGAAEEDYVLSSLGFAATHRLPVLFLCIDNNLSILTETRDRRSWQLDAVAKAFGLETAVIADDPWAVLHQFDQLTLKLPALLLCHVCRERWHVGTGTDGPADWQRHKLVEESMLKLGLAVEADKIKADTTTQMRRIWES
jgi:pyruvate dehydrogenase E1 component alpha subunit